MKNLTLIGLFIAIVVSACTSEQSDEQQKVKEEMTSLEHRIDSLEQVLFSNNTSVDKEAASQLLQSYIRYTESYPASAMCPDYLYKGAGIARGVGVHQRALEMYQQILADYPDFPKQAETQFLIAFTLDNDIKDIEAAKGAYNVVIEKFPDHVFAEQAKERLKTIDLTDEELIELFIERNKESEASGVQ